jgi:putative phosphonate metabolism protein
MTVPEMKARYAIYYTPARESALGRFGIAWLGWDHYLGQPVPPLLTKRMTRAQYAEVTASPRRYGFHATLKAPFHLAPGLEESALCDALQAFAGSQPRVTIPGLFLANLCGFVALVPAEVPTDLVDLAEAAVTQLDRFRSALEPADAARRRTAGLTKRQDALLEAWGYPYVFEEWRFHMTLTDTLKDGLRETVVEELAPLVAAFASEPLTIDAIALFRQPNRETPFTVLRVFPLRDETG